MSQVFKYKNYTMSQVFMYLQFLEILFICKVPDI